jgi:hypothetical protein
MLLFSCQQLPETTRRNEFPNPSCETNIDYWNGGLGFTLSQSSAQKVQGTYSLLATCTIGGNDIYVYTDRLSVTPEAVYTVSVYVRPNVTTTLHVAMDWYRLDSDTTYITTTVGDGTSCSANTWTRIDLTATTPVNALYGSVKIAVEGYFTLSDVIYLDALLLEEAADVGDYFDGSYHPTYADPVEDESSQWDGTAHASASSFTYRTRSTINNVQQIDFTTGRRSLADVTSAGTCHFEVYAPATVPEIGTLIEVHYDTHFLWSGRVADTETVYGMIQGTDTLRVSCEGYLAAAGRAEVTLDAQDTVNLLTLASEACTTKSLSAGSGPATSVTASHNAYQGNLLSYLQRLQMTGYGRLKEGRETFHLVARDVVPYDQRGGGFTDTEPDADQTKYSDLRFAARADVFYDSVRVEPETVAAATDGDGAQSLVVSTYSSSVGDAEVLAGYILDLYSTSTLGPSQLSIIANAQANDSWAQILDLNALVGEPGSAGGPVYQRQQVTFRGETHTMIIEGAQLSATPDHCRVTFFLSNADYPYLILDDAAYGLLGSGRLG